MKRWIGFAAAALAAFAVVRFGLLRPADVPGARASDAARLTERARADFYARRFDSVARLCREALAAAPRETAAALLLADAYAQSGRKDEALAQALAAVDPQGAVRDRAGLGRVFAAAGKRDEALRIAEPLAADPSAAADGALAFDLGLIYAALDAREQAFRWLATAAAAGVPGLGHLRDDPRLDALRGDPRYLDLLAKLKTPGE